eukprot:887931_1
MRKNLNNHLHLHRWRNKWNPNPYALQVEALEQINGDLRQAKDKLQHIIGDLRHENERLKSKAQKASIDHMEAIKSLDSFTQSLQAENIRLQAESSELNEEYKETKLELIRVKKENQQLKVTMNTSNYLEWTHSELVDWIISIDDGAYAQYE